VAQTVEAEREAVNFFPLSPISTRFPITAAFLFMPTYEYACPKCGHQFEQFQSMRDEPLKKCPKCGKSGLKRLVGGGAGLIFKGSGFYITDYKNKSGGKSDGGGESKSGGKSGDSKPAGEAKSSSSSGSGSGKSSDAGKK
jgi:putative FmdB family regulatory protein